MLLETKLNKKGVEELLARSFFGWGCENNFDYHSGDRILILWKKDLFNVQACFMCEQLVHYKVDIMGCSTTFDLTVVYGLHSVAHRKDLWKQLLSYIVPSPWLVGGDFNTIFDMENKLGGKAINYTDLTDGIN